MGKDWPRFLPCILQPLIPIPIDTDPSTLGGREGKWGERVAGCGGGDNNRPVGPEPSLHYHPIATAATLATTAALATTATLATIAKIVHRSARESKWRI
jgi:hypothetical protein